MKFSIERVKYFHSLDARSPIGAARVRVKSSWKPKKASYMSGTSPRVRLATFERARAFDGPICEFIIDLRTRKSKYYYYFEFDSFWSAD